MGIVVDESIILGLAGLIFVPVFLFCIKMIMKTGTIENKQDHLAKKIECLESEKKDTDKAKSTIHFLEYQVSELKKDVDNINARFSSEDSDLRRRDRERKEREYHRRTTINDGSGKDEDDDVKVQRWR